MYYCVDLSIGRLCFQMRHGLLGMRRWHFTMWTNFRGQSGYWGGTVPSQVDIVTLFRSVSAVMNSKRGLQCSRLQSDGQQKNWAKNFYSWQLYNARLTKVPRASIAFQAKTKRFLCRVSFALSSGGILSCFSSLICLFLYARVRKRHECRDCRPCDYRILALSFLHSGRALM